MTLTMVLLPSQLDTDNSIVTKSTLEIGICKTLHWNDQMTRNDQMSDDLDLQ
jgi:hypothetical protein